MWGGQQQQMQPFNGQQGMAQNNPNPMMASLGAFCGGMFGAMSGMNGMMQDGQMRTERYSSSNAGNGQMREAQQSYSNSGTGVDKMSLERQIGDRGRKMVREQNYQTGEEQQTDTYQGMSEEDYPEFRREWDGQAATMPQQHCYNGNCAQALPGPPQQYQQGPCQGQHCDPRLQYQQPQPQYYQQPQQQHCQHHQQMHHCNQPQWFHHGHHGCHGRHGGGW